MFQRLSATNLAAFFWKNRRGWIEQEAASPQTLMLYLKDRLNITK